MKKQELIKLSLIVIISMITVVTCKNSSSKKKQDPFEIDSLKTENDPVKKAKTILYQMYLPMRNG